MDHELAEAWRMSNDKNLALLDAIPDGALADRYSPKTRTVAAQFAHMHNVRVSHLERRGPEFLGDLSGFPRGAQPSKRELRTALVASEHAIAQLLEKCGRTGKVKNWGGGPPATYLGYFIAHEAHHRGLAIVALRLSGTKLPKDTLYGLWYWRKKQSDK